MRVRVHGHGVSWPRVWSRLFVTFCKTKWKRCGSATMSPCNKLPNLQRSQTMTAENEGCCSGQTSKNGFTRKTCHAGAGNQATLQRGKPLQHTNRQSRTRQARTIARSGPSLRRCDYRAARPPSLVYGRPIPFMDALSKLLFGRPFPSMDALYHFLLWTQR